MSIFDKIMGTAAVAATPAVPAGNQSQQFTFAALPESVDQLKRLPEASMDSPFKTAALTVAALCAYAADPEVGTPMLNYLKGPQPLSPYEQSFLRDRFRDKTYVPFSYFEGATPANNYIPTAPYRITISSNPYSAESPDYYKVFIRSSGADSERSVRLRRKGEQWFLWEQFLLADIRRPVAEDPWA